MLKHKCSWWIVSNRGSHLAGSFFISKWFFKIFHTRSIHSRSFITTSWISPQSFTFGQPEQSSTKTLVRSRLSSAIPYFMVYKEVAETSWTSVNSLVISSLVFCFKKKYFITARNIEYNSFKLSKYYPFNIIFTCIFFSWF